MAVKAMEKTIKKPASHAKAMKKIMKKATEKRAIDLKATEKPAGPSLLDSNKTMENLPRVAPRKKWARGILQPKGRSWRQQEGLVPRASARHMNWDCISNLPMPQKAMKKPAAPAALRT